ncbi:MAG TPA: M23 family metallopeptidase [Candidatus Sulfomarinibacteraceae bacterium]|nr:M23 family metallopeptidase [Candidatus Sulfomarinibacteraceae bacterium]
MHRRSVGVARGFAARVSGLTRGVRLASRPGQLTFSASLRRGLVVRLASERMVPVAAALVVLAASVVSFQPTAAQPVGDTRAGGAEVRLAIGGGPVDGGPLDAASGNSMAVGGVLAGRAVKEDVIGTGGADVRPPDGSADDGTIYKPVAVNTTVQDGRELLQTYTVKPGDTLTGIASRHGVSMMTVWWANKLTSKDDLHVGQKLVIPPVNGIVVTVRDVDTLDSLAARYKVDPAEILAVNGLDDPNLIIGQTLTLPDAVGAPIPTPKPVARSSGGGGGSCNCPGPSTYSGGSFDWPVVGGGNYISQGFRYGHYGLDIAADYGSRVRATGAGRVIFAGWKSNGGGYQVWIAHGSGLYTTYNHMSAITVSAGESVTDGEQVGRIGASGRATGPHLHLEVWVGAPWNGGYRVNPLKYL